MTKAVLFLTATAAALLAQSPENVLVVINQNSPLSRSIGEYYALKRAIPLANLCRLPLPVSEEISRQQYDQTIAKPLAAFLKSRRLQEKILYIVTTGGVPLRIAGDRDGPGSNISAVDSELTLLYAEMHGQGHVLYGYVPNPYFGKTGVRFTHPAVPIYLVTRLAAYDFPEVKRIIDRALAARNRGKFVIDLKSSDNEPGNNWLRDAARKLPRDRVVLDETDKVLLDEKDVIAYAGWGSNDRNRRQRFLHFQWLPGAIMTEFVSTNARTFARPPDSWTIGTWADQKTWFAGAPQTLTADYLHEGATGASGHVYEPYLHLTPRPDFVLPAYAQGRNLAESFYLGIPGLSWMNVVIGDPLCALAP